MGTLHNLCTPVANRLVQTLGAAHLDRDYILTKRVEGFVPKFSLVVPGMETDELQFLLHILLRGCSPKQAFDFYQSCWFGELEEALDLAGISKMERGGYL